MTRKSLSASVAAALCVSSAAPALAQEYRFVGFDAPRGTSATVALRVPLSSERSRRVTYGVALRQGQTVGMPTTDGQTVTRAINLADLRFTERGVRNARLAGFDLANMDRSRRMNLTGENSTLLIVGGLVAAGVAICLLADCFDGDDDDAVPN